MHGFPGAQKDGGKQLRIEECKGVQRDTSFQKFPGLTKEDLKRLKEERPARERAELHSMRAVWERMAQAGAPSSSSSMGEGVSSQQPDGVEILD